MEYHTYFNKFNNFKNQINTLLTHKIQSQIFKTFKSDISNIIITTSNTLYNDIILQNFRNTSLFTLTFILIDKLLSKFIKKPYYLLHSIANWGIVYYTFPTVKDIYLNLSNASSLITNPISYQICSALHIYHIIRYKMNKEDIKHHIPTLIVLSIPLFNISQSPLVSHIAFFLCGLPGAIDYILLFLSRNNIIYRITEKNGMFILTFI